MADNMYNGYNQGGYPGGPPHGDEFCSVPNDFSDLKVPAKDKIIKLKLLGIALNEIALAGILLNEAEFFCEKLEMFRNSQPQSGRPGYPPPVTLDDLERNNRKMERMLRAAIKKEIVMQFEMEDFLDIFPHVVGGGGGGY
ncbi:hypothetical protein [Peribacillus tepidiphilus]|jgi:hypothetical protein|uniref:hypothetical protein n=1 Tax=Peribacillus tepidiphilus TaxID=2652445 RepID=UPI0035B55D14